MPAPAPWGYKDQGRLYLSSYMRTFRSEGSGEGLLKNVTPQNAEREALSRLRIWHCRHKH